MQNADIPISDPTPDLGPTAQRILDAAIRVLGRDGYRALTFETIAREAGENPALIRYHFGSKAGLISVLVDAVLYLEAVDLIDTLVVDAGRGRAPAGPLPHASHDGSRPQGIRRVLRAHPQRPARPGAATASCAT